MGGEVCTHAMDFGRNGGGTAPFEAASIQPAQVETLVLLKDQEDIGREAVATDVTNQRRISHWQHCHLQSASVLLTPTLIQWGL